MSPHKVETLPSLGALASYRISQNGFLPPEEPLTRLPDVYYQPWEDIICDLPALLKNETVRGRISKLPMLSISSLETEAEWQRAYSVLSMLAQSHIWGGSDPLDVLPPALSVPLLQVAAHLEVQPVATYAALNLWNCRLITSDADPLQPDSWYALHTFTGTDDESWFYVIGNAMEMRAAPLIKNLLQAIEAAEDDNIAFVTDTLVDLGKQLMETASLLDRMYDRCDPQVFYHRIRPYFAGSQNMESAGLPNGVFYDEDNGQGSWRKYKGGSAGQSSLIQFFDSVLGVKHSGSMDFHHEMRRYMPGPHARFLRDIETVSNIRSFVVDRPGCVALTDAYNSAVSGLCHFRDRHVQLVTRYIILPSRTAQQTAESERKNLAVASSKAGSSEATSQELVGTGGTQLIPFLRQTRDETRAAARARG